MKYLVPSMFISLLGAAAGILLITE